MTTRTQHPIRRNEELVRGAVGGMAASMVMAMFAMIASVTYQHHGFFTPLFHISALTGSPASMMTSVGQAMAGHRFWFAAGPAMVGLMIHLATGAMFGIGFTAVGRRVPRPLLPPAGATYGLLALAVSGLVGLPLAAKVTGSGTVISRMANMVGWPTFAVEHVMFGLALGVFATMRRSTLSAATPTRVPVAAHS